ncbi:MAG: GNAT family N-acetyltransferase [Roseiflexaceae bacterium]|nr:GNAT family N-acetyltransferase [Roseiflexaceae bacterium]
MALTVRPATRADLPALAHLIVELYQSELPGVLTGPVEKQAELLRFTLEANGDKALYHRYVLCDDYGAIIGTGMIEFPGDERFDRAPDGTVAAAVRTLGALRATRLLGAAVRALFGVYRHSDPQSALIYSVVVTARERGRGAGAVLMDHLEHTIRSHRHARARLQVLAWNTAAQRFYARRGYVEIWRSSGWRAMLSWPSVVMEKALDSVEATPPSYPTLESHLFWNDSVP